MILDLFAGPGGWDCGARTLGLDPIGIELDRDACATRAAAGLRTIRADVETWPLEQMAGKVEGLIASPPCQDFSRAGLKAGISGERGRLMFTVPAYVRALRPRWIACEQVPPALPWWEDFARQFRSLGYRTWTGVLNAADYGVPQARQRAILLASLERQPLTPDATHARRPVGRSIKRWVTMVEGIGRPLSELVVNDQTGTPVDLSWPEQRPATTIAGRDLVPHPGSNANRFNGSTKSRNDGYRIEERDGLLLQSFPEDWPVQGSKTSRWRQIGNAVPPRLAAAALSAVASRAT